MTAKETWDRAPHIQYDNYLYYHNNVQQLMNTTDQFLYILDWESFWNKDDHEILKELERIISKEVDKHLEKQNINPESMYLDINDKKIISILDLYKLFVCSNMRYPFWEFSYNGLYAFYKECLIADPRYNIKLFIGKIRYIFDQINEEELKIFEKFVNSKWKKDT
jgi:hypothetical protein